MMGSAAFTGMAAAMRFVSSGRYSAPAAIGLTVGGIPAVLIAVWLVKSLPLDVVRWGVIVVVLYTATTLMRSAAEEQRLVTAARASVAASAWSAGAGRPLGFCARQQEDDRERRRPSQGAPGTRRIPADSLPGSYGLRLLAGCGQPRPRLFQHRSHFGMLAIGARGATQVRGKDGVHPEIVRHSSS